MTSHPWMKFYPGDWRSDPKLRMCSIAARGLWIEMLALMHEAKPYGHLVISGQTPTAAQLAVLVGAQPDQIPKLLEELESVGVYSKTGEGVIYSRRMVRDDKRAKHARKVGKKGGNPKLASSGKQTENPPQDNPPDKGVDKTQRLEARGQSHHKDDEGARCYAEARRICPEPDPGSLVSGLLRVMQPPDVLAAIGVAENRKEPQTYLWGVYRQQSKQKTASRSRASAGQKAFDHIHEVT